jgi:hypothetical protein
MQWTAEVSSKRFRQTLQNLLLWCVGSDQQCATGFLIRHGATPEHGVTTLVTHFSWTIKLQTVKTQLNIELVTKIASQRSEESFLFISNRFFPSLPMCWSKTVFFEVWRQEKHAFSLWHAHHRLELLFIHTKTLGVLFLLRFLLQPNVEHVVNSVS